MQSTQRSFPVRVRTGWIDFSPALHAYTRKTVTRTLGSVGSRIRSVTVRFADPEPHHPAARLCVMDVELTPVGTLSATATGPNPQDLVDETAHEILARLSGTVRADRPEAVQRIA